MRYFRYSMNMKLLNVFCVLIFIPAFLLICLLGACSEINFRALVLYFFWMFLHEILHGIGFSLSKDVKHKNIVYGANLEKGIFYCMCKGFISKKNIMISLMFPFFFIGVVTLVIGLAISNNMLIILSLLNIAGCAGDIAMFVSFLKLPDFKYIDLDDCTGFVLVSDSDLSKYKLFGLDVVEEGKAKDLELAKDYKKITISKLSWIIFALLFLALIVSFIV